MARVSPACAMPTVRVARVAASSFSADRTVAAVSSRSGTAPDDADERLQHFPLGADGLGCPAVKAVG